MSFAPPVSRDGFHYNGDLYVEVGNLNRHKRASVVEITELLRPDLTKANKTPNKDAFGHWYEAQLIHYGLPPSKDKARAKMRLLEALNASALVVPPAIVKLEESLRKEYDVVERKAKALYRASTTTSTEKPGISKKRKQAGGTTSDATTVSLNINVDGLGRVSFDAGADGGFPTGSFTQQESSPAKKAKTSVAKAPAKKLVASRAKVTTKDLPVKKSPAVKEPAVNKEPAVKKQTARRTQPSIKSEPAVKKQTARKTQPAIKNEPAVKKQTARRIQPTIKNEPVVTKQTARKSQPVIKKEPAVTKQTAVRRGPSIKKEPGGHSEPALGLINGYYDISCPSLESEWDYDELSLILCLDTPRVWGAYDFGMFSGILHLPQRPYEPSEDPLPFHWRGRENGEGQMSFGEDFFGEIAFLGDGRIAGMLNVYGNCEFTGMRRPGPTMAPRPANSMRDEWEGYNEDSYEQERTGRWGGGGW